MDVIFCPIRIFEKKLCNLYAEIGDGNFNITHSYFID